jgi:hypothetical protein
MSSRESHSNQREEDAVAHPGVEAPSVSTHPAEDSLEAYVMGRMPVTDQAPLEYHVLVCGPCCERLEETFSYVEALTSALDRREGSADRN